MTHAIIYKTADGVAVIHPTAEALALYSIEAIAQKDVPAPITIYDVPTGVFEIDDQTDESYEVMGSRVHTFAYKIIDISELPDRSQRNQWDVDEADLTDGIGSASNEFN